MLADHLRPAVTTPLQVKGYLEIVGHGCCRSWLRPTNRSQMRGACVAHLAGNLTSRGRGPVW
eukprot:8094028-Pyramimonas_sp.AAC.1